MSRVYFHSPSGEAELLGAERAHAGCLVSEITESRIKANPRSHEALRELAREGHYLSSQVDRPEFLDRFILALAVSRGTLMAWRGHEIRSSSLALNTALALGNNPLKLMARLHGQCEIHCYVEGPNRAWLADMIEHGLIDGALRGGMGWDGRPDHPYGKGPGVVPLLRQRDDEPVVMSDSVCDGFPHAAGESWRLPSGWMPEGWTERKWVDLDDDQRDEYRSQGRHDAFGDLPLEERWAHGMAWLRERSETMMLELRPDDWDTFRFRHGLTVMDLEAPDWRERIEAALGLESAP